MGEFSYSPLQEARIDSMICPHCESEITSFKSTYSSAQAETVVVVTCPHCLKILGIVNHSCDG